MSEEDKKVLIETIAVLIIAAFTNLFSTMMDGDAGASRFLHGLCKAFEHSAATATLLTVASIVRRDRVGKDLGVLFCLNAVLQFVSIWTGWAFVIDDANVYHSGSLNAFTGVCSLLASCYLIYSFYRFSRTYRNSNSIILLSIIVLISFGVAVRLIYPELQVMYVSSMLGFIVLYIYKDDFGRQVQDEELSEQMSIMDTLTVNFECVYKVDLASHRFEALRVSDFIGRQLGGRLGPDTVYEKGMELYCSMNVYAEDREMFRKNTELDHILVCLENEKSYSFEYRILRDDNTMYFSMSAYKILEDGGVSHLLIGFADVDEQRRRWETLMKISSTDIMTGLYNRRAYNEELVRIDKLSASEKQLTEAVMIDLNGLKQANDTYGHEAGDELIVSTSEVLKKVYGGTGKIFRMGGDEFVVIASMQKQDSVEYVRKLKNEMAAWKGNHIDNLSASVGTARMDETAEGTLMEKVVKTADARMYEEKAEYYKLHGRAANL